MTQLRFDIGQFLEKPTGTSEIFSFETPFVLIESGEEHQLKGRVKIMKVEEGFNANVIEAKIPADFSCHRCLKSFTKDVEIEDVEREFMWNEPREIKDPFDVYLVDKKHMVIDISELLRQEIILHFPQNPVCYIGCKGICPSCGQDRNDKNCNCEADTSEKHTPLSILKELIK